MAHPCWEAYGEYNMQMEDLVYLWKNGKFDALEVLAGCDTPPSNNGNNLQTAIWAYGQRMMEQQSAQRLYSALGRHLKFADGWKKFVITSEPEFEHWFGRRADKKRKFYNGKIKCDYYMFTDNTRKKR